MLNGIWVPVITTFDDDGRFDRARFRALLQLLDATPVDGFVVLGSTGEACLLSEAERNAVMKEARRAVPHGVILAGTGAESTTLAVARTRNAFERGADGVLVLGPAYYRNALSEDALAAHYEAVSRASSGPVFLYQFPQANGFAFTPESIRRLRSIPRISGIKDSSGDPDSIRAFVKEGGADFDVAGGSGRRFIAALEAGASGGILAVGNVAPKICCALYDAFRAGQWNEAQRLRDLIVRILDAVGTLGPAGFKAALELLGFPAGPPRAPLAAPAGPELERLREALRSVREECGL